MIVESPRGIVRGSIVVIVKRRQWMHFVTKKQDKDVTVLATHGTVVLNTEATVNSGSAVKEFYSTTFVWCRIILSP